METDKYIQDIFHIGYQKQWSPKEKNLFVWMIIIVLNGGPPWKADESQNSVIIERKKILF